MRTKEKGVGLRNVSEREIGRMQNLVTSLMLSGARIIIVERFTKSVISGC